MSSTEADLVGRPPHEEKQTAPERYGLDSMFAPGSVAVIGATSRPRTLGRARLGDPPPGEISRKSVCRQREPSGSAGTHNVREHSRHPWTRGFGYSGYPGGDGPAAHRRV